VRHIGWLYAYWIGSIVSRFLEVGGRHARIHCCLFGSEERPASSLKRVIHCWIWLFHFSSRLPVFSLIICLGILKNAKGNICSIWNSTSTGSPFGTFRLACAGTTYVKTRTLQKAKSGAPQRDRACLKQTPVPRGRGWDTVHDKKSGVAAGADDGAGAWYSGARRESDEVSATFTGGADI
jgi:hypothetical protein